MSKKTVIIGGVAGGATTAARLRRRDESMEIVMFEKGEYISYANCGLPYYIGGVIQSRDALILQTPEAMHKKFNIDIRIASEVIEIIPEKKVVTVKNLKTQEVYQESYDNLVIATGSSPLKPPIEGIDQEGIYTLWTVPDTDRIKEHILKKKPKTAAVIGGGFIGLEMAENLHATGIEVSVIEMQNQVMAPVDYEMAQLLHENMAMNNVELILGDGVKAFKKQEDGIRIELASGKSVVAQMVLLSIGVRPNSALAGKAGLKLNERGGVWVDANLRTSNSDIYAVGDVIEVENFITKDKTMVPLAGPANKQARICADNIAGDQKEYHGTMGTSVAKVFDLNVAVTGLNEKALKAMGKERHKDYECVMISQKSHAGYYPEATPMNLKLLFDKEGKIFGGQIVGQDGIDKRIDTLAVAIRMGADIYDLTEMELAYAPPFSSAKDPLNMAGFVAENVLEGMASFIEWDAMDELIANPDRKDDFLILDITEEMERMVYSIPGSYHIPLGQLRNRLEELDKNKLIIPYCAIGVRSYNAARILMQNGFEKVKILSGGTSFYKSMHYNEELREEVERVEEGKEYVTINKEIKVLDCCGLQCPGPIMKVHDSICEMKEGEILQVSATDMGFTRDIGAWCKTTGNTLLKTERKNKENIVFIRKGQEACGVNPGHSELPKADGKTIIVFSGDLDKVLASFIIANGAASMGKPVTMFFTFWGLNALRKNQKVNVKKPFLDAMFGAMMPRGSKKLTLSNLNMGGMGTMMMRKVMKDKNVNTVEELMMQAMANGVKLVACTMSMDVMGITKEELIDGVELAGVASYLGDAEESNVNLFV